MDISLILKIAGIGILVNVLCQVLSKTGKDEQAGFVSVAGIIIVLLVIVSQIAELVAKVRGTFGI